MKATHEFFQRLGDFRPRVVNFPSFGYGVATGVSLAVVVGFIASPSFLMSLTTTVCLLSTKLIHSRLPLKGE